MRQKTVKKDKKSGAEIRFSKFMDGINEVGVSKAMRDYEIDYKKSDENSYDGKRLDNITYDEIQWPVTE